MEKITKEELLEELKLHSLTDEELANVSGEYDPEMVYKKCFKNCLAKGFSSEECQEKC